MEPSSTLAAASGVAPWARTSSSGETTLASPGSVTVAASLCKCSMKSFAVGLNSFPRRRMIPKGPHEPTVHQRDGAKRAGLDFAQNGRRGQQRDAGVDLDRAFDRFDVVELHCITYVEMMLRKHAVDFAANGQVVVEADEGSAVEFGEFDFAPRCQSMVRRADQDHRLASPGLRFDGS